MSIPDLALMQASLVGALDPEIVALEARLRAAQLAADVAVLDALLSDDLLFTGPDGQLGTKAADLAAHGSGDVRVRAHAPEELRVRRVGTGAAVSALRTRLAVEVGGALTRGTYRYTRVWAREAHGPRRHGGCLRSPVNAGVSHHEPMALTDLSEADRDVVHQSLVALRRGRYLDEDDIESRIGVPVPVYDALLARWPAVDDRDDDSHECLIINNALNEVCHGVHIPARDWPRWFGVPRDAVLAAYRRWARSRGWDHTGVR